MIRRELWSELLSLIDAFSCPWCVLGDFNDVIGANEYRGLTLPNRTSCEEFKSFYEVGNLNHIVTRGVEFTCTNKRSGVAHIEKRLDRVLCNDSWLSEWHYSSCFTLPKYASDHHPLMLNCFNALASHKSQFRFHRMWIQHPALHKVVEDHWKIRVVGCPMYIMATKLKTLKHVLKVWNREIFGNIHLRVQNALALVKDIQLCIKDNGLTDDLMAQEEVSQRDLSMALRAEEEFWREKSRVNWQLHGDRNTSYFHKIAKIRHATKSFTMLRNRDDIILEHQDISEHVLGYFQNLYASQNSIQHSDLIRNVIPI
ncbi:PREDICTED: uncharacterized protein LOC109356184 [Lupinus angustifolius]|uniref:uncharacterized protein LOC109356184 n=1 Tax=Lupinus angustifolius TaxID=3871 RepID=UPI00092F64B5|nr:PREDICTED: uncharacterized protein LOC109356184 [Lupinus angustifolius]